MITLLIGVFTLWLLIQLIGIAFDALEVVIFGVSAFISKITKINESRIFPWVFWIITISAIAGFIWFGILH